MPPPPRPRIFHGWIVVGAAFAVMFAGFGVGYSFGAFFTELEREFAARRGDLAIVFAISGALYFGLGLASGAAADRWGPRRVAFLGMAIMTVGLVLASRADALWQIYLASGLGIGIGVGFSYVPSLGAVQPWFQRRRAFASGIAIAGIGAGTLVIPPTAAWLVDGLGWRTSYLVLAAGTLVVGGGGALLLDSRPQRRGLAPDGLPAGPQAAQRATGVDFRTAVRSQPFRLLALAAFLTSFGIFTPFVHLAPAAVDLGATAPMAAALLGIIGAGSILGRFVIGSAADRFGRRQALIGVVAAQAALLLFWSLADRYWMLAAFAGAFGVSYGGYVALMPTLCADFFGARAIGAVMGAVFSGISVGCLLGPPIAGFAFDATGSYAWPVAGCALLTAVAAAASLRLPDPDRWTDRAGGAG
ncbi:MFS transporter [Stella sp.]|uniref:MFS transporter n=1 Tax=Stella sp. TaxID=2912054 RepID=UPI0035B40F2D